MVNPYILPPDLPRPIDDGACDHLVGMTMPAITLKVIAAIHWEALRLWLKGLRILPRPPAPGMISIVPASARESD